MYAFQLLLLVTPSGALSWRILHQELNLLEALLFLNITWIFRWPLVSSSKAQDSIEGAAPDSQPFPCRVLSEHLLRPESKTSHFHLSFFSLLLLFKIIIVVFQGRRYGPWSCGNVGRPESLGLSPHAPVSLETLAHQPQVVTAPGLMFPTSWPAESCVCVLDLRFLEKRTNIWPPSCIGDPPDIRTHRVQAIGG